MGAVHLTSVELPYWNVRFDVPVSPHDFHKPYGVYGGSEFYYIITPVLRTMYRTGMHLECFSRWACHLQDGSASSRIASEVIRMSRSSQVTHLVCYFLQW